MTERRVNLPATHPGFASLLRSIGQQLDASGSLVTQSQGDRGGLPPA